MIRNIISPYSTFQRVSSGSIPSITTSPRTFFFGKKEPQLTFQATHLSLDVPSTQMSICIHTRTCCMIAHTLHILSHINQHSNKSVQEKALSGGPVILSLAGGLVSIKAGCLSPQTGYNWVRWSMRRGPCLC